MSKIKHKYSVSLNIFPMSGGPNTTEIFEASEADSWDEAIKEVSKGVYDRKLQLEEERKKWIKENGTLVNSISAGKSASMNTQVGDSEKPKTDEFGNKLNNTKPSTPAGK